MAATLLIIGLTLFLVGSLGLIARFRERGKPALSVCIPFVSIVPTRECWSDVRVFVFARLLGLALMGAALGLAVGRNPVLLDEPQRFWDTGERPVLKGSKQERMDRFVNVSDTILAAVRQDTNKDLSGRIHGEAFTYDRVEVIDGVLSARQGSGFLPEREVRIFLSSDLSGESIRERETISVRPGDPVSPVVHISWLDEEDKLQTRIVRRGYRMELQLAPLDRYQLKGFLRLLLPDTRRSYLSGEFVAHTNHLRYTKDGGVDLGYSHPDTLEYVARQYLRQQYPSGAIDNMTFRNTVIRGSRTEGDVRARIELDSGRVESRKMVLHLARGEWTVRRESVTREVLQGDESGDDDAEPGDGDRAEQASPANGDSVRVIRFADLSDYVGEKVRTRRLDGKLQSGTIQAVDEDRVTLETSLSGGTVRYRVKKERLDRVHLANGDKLVIESNRADEQEKARDRAGASAGGDDTDRDKPDDTGAKQGTDSESAGDGDSSGISAELRALQGQRVRITDNAGKSRTGILEAVDEDEITLTVPMGGGQVDYYYEFAEIDGFKAVEQR